MFGSKVLFRSFHLLIGLGLMAHIVTVGASSATAQIAQPNGEVRAILIDGDHMYIGGSFTEVDGQAQRMVARLDADGKLDQAWSSPFLAHSNGILTMAIDPVTDDLLLGGNFINTQADLNGSTVTLSNRTARVDKATGEFLGVLNDVTSSNVTGFAFDADNIYVAGSNGLFYRQSRAGVSGQMPATTVNVDFGSGPVDIGANNAAIAQDGAALFIGGAFDKVGGIDRDGIAKLQTDGTLLSWAPVLNTGPSSMTLDGDDLYLGGNFTSVDGNAFSRLARIHKGTAVVDSDWKPTVNSRIDAIYVAGNDVYIGGAFTSVDGVPRQRLAKLSKMTGAVDLAWVNDANDGVYAIQATATKIFVGGRFTSLRGENVAYFAEALSATIPDAPTINGVTVGNAQASIAFTAPANDGGSPITGYTATSSPGGLTGTCTASPCVVTGLTNGMSYTFTVTATSAVGTSTASVVSEAVIPATIPNAPTINGVTVGNAQASIAFTAPANDGGSPITGYTATSSPGGLTGTCTASPCVVTGLTNGTSYTFRVTATNAVGISMAAVVSEAVIPATVPDAPTITFIQPANGALVIGFSEPVYDGGAPVTNYEYQLNESAWVLFNPPIVTTPATVTGLVNGTDYAVKFRAVNSMGSGAASNAGAGSPFTAPSSPQNIAVTPQPGGLSVSWEASANDGGRAISAYRVLVNGEVACEVDPSQDNLSCTIDGLSAEQAYSVEVVAVTSVAVTPSSEANQVEATPMPIIPVPTTSLWALWLLFMMLLAVGRYRLIKD